MICIKCHRREVAKSGRGAKLLLCDNCDVSVDIAAGEESQRDQLNIAINNAYYYFSAWREHPEQYDAPSWGLEYLRKIATPEEVGRVAQGMQEREAQAERARVEAEERERRARREELIRRYAEAKAAGARNAKSKYHKLYYEMHRERLKAESRENMRRVRARRKEVAG